MISCISKKSNTGNNCELSRQEYSDNKKQPVSPYQVPRTEKWRKHCCKNTHTADVYRKPCERSPFVLGDDMYEYHMYHTTAVPVVGT